MLRFEQQAPTRVSTAQPEELRAQIDNLHAAVVNLRAQKVALKAQIDALPPSSELRANLAAEMIDMDATIVRNQVSLAGAEAQLGMSRTTPVVGVPPTLPPQLPIGPTLSNWEIVGGALVLINLALVLPLLIGISRRIWRRAPKDTSAIVLDKVLPRLDRLENAVDAIAIEVERISEGQRFVTKVLTEQAVQVNATTPSDAGLGEAKPFLALGAGPIEPIRVAERQAVRQSITPH